MKRLVFFSIVVLAGCFGAHRDNAAMGDDAGPVCGDVTCDDKPDAVCADSDTLRTYSAACTDGACSYPSEDVECGNDGCCTDHCCAAVPSNATDFGAVEATGLVVAPPDGEFDTDVDCVATSALGKCTVVTRTDLPQACVCRADEITIGTLKVKGARALVLLAKKQVTVTTMLDVSGDSMVDGPGATYHYEGATNGVPGGPGGSFAKTGGGTQPAPAYGEPSLVPLLGGMAGKNGGITNGGGGGGALQITAGVKVDVQGVINAGGGGGRGGTFSYGTSGGGGGGSGGGILVEAPTVIVSGTIVANGGGGGGGGGSSTYGSTGWGGGEYGFPNPDPMTQASGGSGDDGHGCPLYGYVYGGDGGYGGFGTVSATSGESSGYDSRCIGAAAFVGGGGGGGGIGRIRINTTTGCQCGGSKIAPQPSFGMLVKQ